MRFYRTINASRKPKNSIQFSFENWMVKLDGKFFFFSSGWTWWYAVLDLWTRIKLCENILKHFQLKPNDTEIKFISNYLKIDVRIRSQCFSITHLIVQRKVRAEKKNRHHHHHHHRNVPTGEIQTGELISVHLQVTKEKLFNYLIVSFAAIQQYGFFSTALNHIPNDVNCENVWRSRSLARSLWCFDFSIDEHFDC